MQQGDVKLFQTDDDGEIVVEGGIVEMSGGLETTAYLALFGGNEDDDGSQDNPKTWWGNLDETEPARRYISRTQELLKSSPATSGNLRRVEEAVKQDLNFFLTEKIANSVTASASIPALNRVKIVITIEAEGVETSFEFTENWKAAT